MTERMKARAYELIAAGELTSDQIARRCRTTPQSIAALKANFTRGNGPTSVAPAPSRSRSTSSSRVRSTDVHVSGSTSEPVVVRIQSRRLAEALNSGRPVELRFDLSAS